MQLLKRPATAGVPRRPGTPTASSREAGT
jgi:hypothetical protein